MLRELISIFRSSDPLGEMGKHFVEMLRIAQEMMLKAGEVLLDGKWTPEERTWIYENDVKVNQLERRIRKQIIAHLSLTGTKLDLPYCLLLISLVKDVERIGDYSKNLTEIGDFFTGPLPDDESVSELRQIRNGVEAASAGLAQILDKSDHDKAIDLIHEGSALAHRCDMLVTKVAQSPYDAATAVAIVLAARYYKRIGGHVLNILSSVVMPLHKVDYYDEDSIPSELKTKG